MTDNANKSKDYNSHIMSDEKREMLGNSLIEAWNQAEMSGGDTRSAMINILKGDILSIHGLGQLFCDKNDKNRSTWAIVLGWLEDPVAFNYLISVIRDSQENINIKKYAVAALGHINDSRAFNELINIVKENEDEGMKIEAIEAFGCKGTPKNVSALGAFLKNSPNAKIRRAAAKSLGYTEEKSCADALATAAVDDEDSGVSSEALYSLRRILGHDDARKKIVELQELREREKEPIPKTESKEPSDDCFVAGVCYGNPTHPDVMLLRQFRDNLLKKWELGRKFIRGYYHFGPKLASILREEIMLRSIITRIIVRPVVAVAKIWNFKIRRII